MFNTKYIKNRGAIDFYVSFCVMAAGRYKNNNVEWSAAPLEQDEELRLLYNYLRISPWYALAARQIEIKVRRLMPEHTRAIVHCYRRYGDVYAQTFEHWVGPARKLSGKPTSQPQALIVEASNVSQVAQGYKLIAIKEGSPLPEVLRELTELLKRCGSFRDRPPAITGLRAKTMWRALAVVYARARDPAAELWRIGARVGVIDRFAGRIDPEESKKSQATAQIRRELTQTVIRFLQLALLLSQSAALGTFPDTKSPLIERSQQMVFAFENRELDRALSACAAEYDFVVEKSLQLSVKRPDSHALIT